MQTNQKFPSPSTNFFTPKEDLGNKLTFFFVAKEVLGDIKKTLHPKFYLYFFNILPSEEDLDNKLLVVKDFLGDKFLLSGTYSLLNLYNRNVSRHYILHPLPFQLCFYQGYTL